MTARTLRAKRAAAGISGRAICQIVKISRTKLSDLENENIAASPEELRRIEAAIEQIIQPRQRVKQFASQEGLSLVGVQV
jgi:transcriptional regulator with XRE-family HTH domain